MEAAAGFSTIDQQAQVALAIVHVLVPVAAFVRNDSYPVINVSRVLALPPVLLLDPEKSSLQSGVKLATSTLAPAAHTSHAPFVAAVIVGKVTVVPVPELDVDVASKGPPLARVATPLKA